MTDAHASILTVNAGSSSLRLDLFVRKGEGVARVQARHVEAADGGAAHDALDGFVEATGAEPAIVAHRVVRGGASFVQPCVVDAEAERSIERLGELAPLHNPPALEWIRRCRRQFPRATQFAAFDTAFYADLPRVARTYAIEARIAERHGLRRYGFHGIAHDAMGRRWRELAPSVDDGGRVLSLQLGAGCSITATARGRPVDTSMGFTPLEGLMMATRGGDLDPGLLLHLQCVEGWSPRQLEEWLNHRCGLAGVSESSGDMRALLASTEPAAALAVEMFCYRAKKYVGAFLAALGGADAVLFGGGIGEHAPAVRARILAGMTWAGIDVDDESNAAARQGDARIDSRRGAAQVWVIAVDEATRIAQYAAQLVPSLP